MSHNILLSSTIASAKDMAATFLHNNISNDRSLLVLPDSLQAGIILGSLFTLCCLLAMVLGVYVLMWLCDCGAYRWCAGYESTVVVAVPPQQEPVMVVDPQIYRQMVQRVLQPWKVEYTTGGSISSGGVLIQQQPGKGDIELGVVKTKTTAAPPVVATVASKGAIQDNLATPTSSSSSTTTTSNDGGADATTTHPAAPATPPQASSSSSPQDSTEEDDDDTNECCVICMEPYLNPRQTSSSTSNNNNKEDTSSPSLLLVQPNCPHVFHSACIEQWLLVQQKAQQVGCPLCQTIWIPTDTWRATLHQVLQETNVDDTPTEQPDDDDDDGIDEDLEEGQARI